MFNPTQIEKIISESRIQKWPYPKTFDALKEAGVEFYEVDVSTCAITYHGGGRIWKEPEPKDFSVLSISKNFDVKETQAALERNRRKETTFVQFLQGIAKAGVGTYRVDMAERTVTYKGLTGEEYAENVPVLY